MIKWCLHIIFSLTCLVCLGQTPQLCVEDIKQVRKEKFATTHIGDTLMSLSSEKFRAAVVVFYKTDCPFCEKLMPELKRLHNAFNNSGFEVFAICLNEDKTAWKQYINSNQYEGFKNYCDGLSYAGQAAEAYHVFATPSLFLVNSKWQIVAKPKELVTLEQNIASLCKSG